MANQTEEICGGELVPINGATQAKRNLQVGKVDPDPRLKFEINKPGNR